MANKKFSEFVLKTSTSDVSHIVGYNGAENVQITPANFVTGGGTGVFLPLAGGTMVGNTIHNDNVKSIYGTNSDLEIYNDGANSFIQDVGVGSLFFKTNGTGIFFKETGGETLAQFLKDGAINLYHNNVLKFATTSTGISVTGGADTQAIITGTTTAARLDIKTDSQHRFLQTIESDGKFRLFNQTTNSEQFSIASNNNATFAGQVVINSNSGLSLKNADNTNEFRLFNSGATGGSGGILTFNAGNVGERMRLDSSGNLGLGTSIINQKFTVAGNISISGGNNCFLTFNNGDANIEISNNSDGRDLLFKTYGGTGIGNLERMRIDKDGNVAIGSTSPDGKLEVKSATGEVGFNAGTSSSPERANMYFTTDGSGWKFNIGKYQSSTFSPLMTFQDNGNVGIGASSPLAKLHIKDGSALSSALTNTSALIEGFSQSILQIASHSSGYGQIAFGDQDDGFDGGIIYSNSSRYLSFEAANSERMRLTSAGGLLIGATTAESTAVLQVEGSSGNTSSYIIQKNLNAGSSAFVSFKQFSDSGQSEYWRNSSTRTTSGGANSQNIYNSNGVINFWTGGVQNFRLQTDGDLKLLQNNKGLILTSANGTAYRITVANDGTITSTAE